MLGWLLLSTEPVDEPNPGLLPDFVESAGGPLVLVSLLATAGWAAFTFARSRRNERAEWLHQLFNDVYFSDRLTGAKNTIEYRYDSYLGPLLERRMNDRHVKISKEDVAELDQLDNFLNYIEHVLGLQDRGLMTRRERLVIFDYWPNVISQDPNLAALRRYVSMCGYELINKEINLDNTDYIAVYGSLMSGLGPPKQPDFSEDLELVGSVLIPGELYLVQGSSYPYPGLSLVSDPEDRILHSSRRSKSASERKAQQRADAVVGELYRVTDASVIQKMDEWEEYDATNPGSSPYVRRIIRMLEPEVDAWIYVGNHEDRSEVLDQRDWRDFQKKGAEKES